MNEVQTILNELKQSAKTNVVTDTWAGELAIGYHIRQGDVQVERVEDSFAHGDIMSDSRQQLAPGDSVGSRHIVEGDVTVFAPKSTDPIDGPVFKVGSNGAELTHPEHRNFMFKEGTYRCTFQQDFLAEEKRRLQD